jgi:hypothetical protein
VGVVAGEVIKEVVGRVLGDTDVEIGVEVLVAAAVLQRACFDYMKGQRRHKQQRMSGL